VTELWLSIYVPRDRLALLISKRRRPGCRILCHGHPPESGIIPYCEAVPHVLEKGNQHQVCCPDSRSSMACDGRGDDCVLGKLETHASQRWSCCRYLSGVRCGHEPTVLFCLQLWLLMQVPSNQLVRIPAGYSCSIAQRNAKL
jgi:hypothetical protein